MRGRVAHAALICNGRYVIFFSQGLLYDTHIPFLVLNYFHICLCIHTVRSMS